MKIGDFGLVTAIEENCCDNCNIQTPLSLDCRHTDQVGTKLYMSPEQVRPDLLVLSFSFIHYFHTNYCWITVVETVRPIIY